MLQLFKEFILGKVMKNEMRNRRRRRKKNFHFSDGYQIPVARDVSKGPKQIILLLLFYLNRFSSLVLVDPQLSCRP